VQAVDDEARALIGETDDTPEPSFPFVPRIARLPRDRSDRDRPERDRPERPERIERPGRQDLEPAALAPAPAPGDEDDQLPGAEDGTPDSLTSLLEAVPNFRGDLVVPEPRPAGAGHGQDDADDGDPAEAAEATESDRDREEEQEAVEPPAPAASAGSAYADVLMPRSVGAHRDRLKGNTDRQAEADGVRPGRRAAVPSWDEIVFGTRRKKE
jgi:hypothetical protein